MIYTCKIFIHVILLLLLLLWYASCFNTFEHPKTCACLGTLLWWSRSIKVCGTGGGLSAVLSMELLLVWRLVKVEVTCEFKPEKIREAASNNKYSGVLSVVGCLILLWTYSLFFLHFTKNYRPSAFMQHTFQWHRRLSTCLLIFIWVWISHLAQYYMGRGGSNLYKSRAGIFGLRGPGLWCGVKTQTLIGPSPVHRN